MNRKLLKNKKELEVKDTKNRELQGASDTWINKQHKLSKEHEKKIEKTHDCL